MKKKKIESAQVLKAFPSIFSRQGFPHDQLRRGIYTHTNIKNVFTWGIFILQLRFVNKPNLLDILQKMRGRKKRKQDEAVKLC